MSLRHLFVAVVISLLASCSRLSTTDTPTGAAPVVYINQNLGFDVPGYKYNQADIPCDIESSVVESVIRASAKKNIRMEAVNTSSKINNAAGIPVLAIDIVRLVLGGKGKQFGVKTESELPAIKIKAAVFSNNADKSVRVKEHGCAILVLNEFTPSSNVLDMGTAATVCSATRKCIDELSADLVDWMAPLIQKR